ncbi:S24 family peptidase [Neptuniibacter halophilus]|uniref:S24 family peptidase n=1 Tax=Neptuniibacter halophilus TaxID=651666 RepID=UPI00257366FC|nr:LexA family transcriptional regulator [Neptuniibacter halophilus]
MEMYERIQQRMAELGLKSVDIVNRTQLSKGAISQWLNGHTKPRGKNLDLLAEVLRCTPEWLQFGVGDDDGYADRFVSIPVLDVELAAGSGMHIDCERVKEHLPISVDWLFQNNLFAGDLAIVKVVGDSMASTLSDGSLILVDTSDKRPVSGKVYAIATDEDLRVKRLLKRTDGSWVISSDNKMDPAYQDEIIPPYELNNLRIIGRAVKVLMGDI